MSIEVKSAGSWDTTRAWFNRMLRGDQYLGLEQYGLRGVDALSSATPRRTGLVATSWKFKISQSRNYKRIDWYNTDVEGGSVVAVLIQYGHGTGNGGYVVGRDYINPAMRPIFDKIADDMWKQVKA